ncbi:hypothetical protein R6Q59_033393 [Mikania micrantha]
MQKHGGKYKFEGLHPLKKFGQFVEMDGVDAVEAAEIPTVFVEEEHDLPEYEDVVTRDEPDLDFDFETETIPIKSDLPEQVNLLTIENLEALLEHVKRSVGNPPPAPSFDDQEPPLDAAADLVPRKRRIRDPRTGVVVSEPETEPISSTAGSSSHTKDIDYDSFLAGETGIRVDKGNNVLSDDEPIDIVKIQSRVSELEQDSLSHTLLIQELKTDNELKDKKIKDLETNMGHLSAIILDLKQNSSTAAEPAPELSKADFDELTRSREEGLRKYFAGDIGFKVSIAKSRELMMITDRTIQQEKEAAKFKSTRFIVDVGDSRYNYEDIFEVRWPATDWMKKVPILPDLPEGILDDFKFWVFDEQTYGVIINCGDVEYTFYDPIDLMCFSEKDIKFLNNQEMKVDQDHLEDALEFVVYVRVIMKNEAWSGGKRESSTLMIKCGESDQPAKEKEAEETQN